VGAREPINDAREGASDVKKAPALQRHAIATLTSQITGAGGGGAAAGAIHVLRSNTHWVLTFDNLLDVCAMDLLEFLVTGTKSHSARRRRKLKGAENVSRRVVGECSPGSDDSA